MVMIVMVMIVMSRLSPSLAIVSSFILLADRENQYDGFHFAYMQASHLLAVFLCTRMFET